MTSYSTLDILLTRAIADYLTGNLSFTVLTGIILDRFGNWINGYFISFSGKIKGSVIANQYIVFCIDTECSTCKGIINGLNNY